MAKTEAEILQLLKESAQTKKLSSVSDITLQKIAAQISKMNLSDDIETLIIDAEKDKLVILNDNIRNERAKQKQETEALFKQVPTKEEPKNEPNKIELPQEILSVVEYVNSLKTKEQLQSKRTSIEKAIFEKGVPKDKKDFVEKALERLNITVDGNDSDLADAVVDLYNVANAKSSSESVPNKANGNASDEAIDALVTEALKGWK